MPDKNEKVKKQEVSNYHNETIIVTILKSDRDLINEALVLYSKSLVALEGVELSENQKIRFLKKSEKCKELLHKITCLWW